MMGRRLDHVKTMIDGLQTVLSGEPYRQSLHPGLDAANHLPTVVRILSQMHDSLVVIEHRVSELEATSESD